ncbi:DCC1-like thiol-disulfide oxidoreductase family protein [Winogradskyella maritima]|uniref:Thiol-disulfide oxidoreductase DCC family protein n=1 Tax=Winogradskyella maritima TaxID=1517766 RepID=A0ABV8AJV8_9FLAO|nr:DCC1-like thiol-disulfide oxidoreductase family protein [Winogradskyella maritima]
MIEQVPKNKQLILFDGVCNLCNSSVTKVIKNDPNQHFLFAPLQSKVGQAIIAKYNINTEQTDSIILYSADSGIKTKSSAALHVAKKMAFPYNMAIVFFIVPPFIRNWVYDYVAKHRYKWYGKKESCMIPTPELKARFLD